MIGGRAIATLSEFKYLGVHIDGTLKFTKQIESNINKGNQKLFLFRKIRTNLDYKSAIILYKTMIMPYLEFCNVLLIGCNEREKIKLQQVQNKGLKIATCKDKYFPTIELHRECGLASWETRAFTALNRLMFKYKFHEDFIVQSSVMTRAFTGTIIQMDRPYSSNFVSSVSYVARKGWNDLPSNLCSIETRETFNVLLKTLFKNMYFN